MQLTATASALIPAPLERVFDLAVSCEGFPKILLPHAPIPGVARAEMVGGVPLAAGAERRNYMTDKSVVDEVVIEVDRPRRHAYRWKDPPAFPLSLLIRTGEGDWRFSSEGAGTRVDWTYTLGLTTPLVAPVAKLVVARFAQWMQRGLDRLPAALGV